MEDRKGPSMSSLEIKRILGHITSRGVEQSVQGSLLGLLSSLVAEATTGSIKNLWNLRFFFVGDRLVDWFFIDGSSPIKLCHFIRGSPELYTWAGPASQPGRGA